MRKILVITTILLCFVFASVCSAQEGWKAASPKGYLGIFGGYAMPQDLETDNLPDLSLDNTWVAGAKIGGFFARPLALEIEYYHIGEMDFDNRLFAESISADSIFLNLILRYPETRFHPFIGAGAGWTWVKLDNALPGLDDDNTWAVQGLAGVDIDISSNTSLTVQYRYYYAEPSFAGDRDSKLKTHILTAGFNFIF